MKCICKHFQAIIFFFIGCELILNQCWLFLLPLRQYIVIQEEPEAAGRLHAKFKPVSVAVCNKSLEKVIDGLAVFTCLC